MCRAGAFSRGFDPGSWDRWRKDWSNVVFVANWFNAELNIQGFVFLMQTVDWWAHFFSRRQSPFLCATTRLSRPPQEKSPRSDPEIGPCEDFTDHKTWTTLIVSFPVFRIDFPHRSFLFSLSLSPLGATGATAPRSSRGQNVSRRGLVSLATAMPGFPP